MSSRFIFNLDGYALTESKLVDINIPVKRIDIHVQNAAGTAVSDVALTTNAGYSNSGLSLDGDMVNAYGDSQYTNRYPVYTNSSGDATLWFVPATTGAYNITATPPYGSSYSPFTFHNITATGDQTEIISLQPTNHAPFADANGPYTVAEGSSVRLTGSGTDPDGDTLTYSWDLENDGTFETQGQNPTFSAAGKNGPSSQTVVLKVCDDKNACDTDQTTINITNVAPSVGPITSSANPIAINSSTTASASFTDPAGALDAPYVIEWNWGDGKVDTTSVNQPGNASKDHIYTTAGVYEVKLTVTDADSGTDTEVYQYLSVYAPTPNGIFSAGTKYDSPAGAYIQNPSLTGSVKFGFVYKY